MPSIESALEAALARRSSSAVFDLDAALDGVLAEVDLSPSDCGGRIAWAGADPVVPSPLRLGGAAAIGLVAKSVAAAAMHRWRGGPSQDILVDLRRAPHRLSPFYDFRWERLGGYPVRSSLEAGNMMSAIVYKTAPGFGLAQHQLDRMGAGIAGDVAQLRVIGEQGREPRADLVLERVRRHAPGRGVADEIRPPSQRLA